MMKLYNRTSGPLGIEIDQIAHKKLRSGRSAELPELVEGFEVRQDASGLTLGVFTAELGHGTGDDTPGDVLGGHGTGDDTPGDVLGGHGDGGELEDTCMLLANATGVPLDVHVERSLPPRRAYELVGGVTAVEVDKKKGRVRITFQA